jgi:hypothetical protein
MSTATNKRKSSVRNGIVHTNNLLTAAINANVISTPLSAPITKLAMFVPNGTALSFGNISVKLSIPNPSAIIAAGNAANIILNSVTGTTSVFGNALIMKSGNATCAISNYTLATTGSSNVITTSFNAQGDTCVISLATATNAWRITVIVGPTAVGSSSMISIEQSV